MTPEEKCPTDCVSINYRGITSFAFLTNVVLAIYTENYLYASLFFILFITSIIVHLIHDNIYTNLIDKLAIICIVLYGGYVFFIKRETTSLFMKIAIISTFLLTIYLYCYGYLTESMCFCAEEYNAALYHCLMHLIGSLGHNFIILL